MVLSRSRNDRFISFLMFEIVGVFVLTGVVTMLLAFWTTAKIDSRSGSHNFEELFSDLPTLIGLCVTPAIISLALIVYLRSKKYVVGFAFQKEEVHLLVRGLAKRSLKEVRIQSDEFWAEAYEKKGFWFVTGQKGSLLKEGNANYYFITNNFIWEGQSREREAFYKQLKQFLKRD